MTMMGGDPVIMLDAPLHATERALKKAGMSIDDIDLFEVNEAFASVPTAWLKTTGADPARLNVNGGAIALGHPLGMSGARLALTAVHGMEKRGDKRALATMCVGVGQGVAMAIERLN
jgi:acetyl-CoA C-acetyltransferase